jgi:predicted HTH transcriptional regulator
MRTPTKPSPAIKSIENLLENVLGQEKKQLEDKLLKEKKILASSLEHEIYKTVAALMNSHGGKLIIGVEDNGIITGIEKDFETFHERKNLDGWLQHFTNLIEDHIDKELMMYIKHKAITIDGKTVVTIDTQKSSKPVYVEYQDSKGQNKMEFYIRGFNTTQMLNEKQAYEYSREHWKT